MESIDLQDIKSNDELKKKIRSLPLLHELEVVNSNYDNFEGYRRTIIQRVDGGLLYHCFLGTEFTTTLVPKEYNR
jgi:hypothetical protein